MSIYDARIWDNEKKKFYTYDGWIWDSRTQDFYRYKNKGPSYYSPPVPDSNTEKVS